MSIENNFKFLKAPTPEQIEATLKASGVSASQFERFHGLYDRCLAHCRYGHRKMPARYWHLFMSVENAPVAPTVTTSTPKTSVKKKPVKTHALEKLMK